MKRIFLLVRKDFKRKWKNPVVIGGFLLIPVLFTLLLGSVFGRSEEDILPSVSVLAVDKDNSILSKFFLSALTQGELSEIIELEKVEEEKGQKLIDNGKASALLVIPENFGKNAWEGEPSEIQLFKNPTEQFLPQIVEEIIDTACLIFSSFLSVFSDELGMIKNFTETKEIPNEVISSLSIQVKNRVEGLAKFVFPPVISLEQKTVKKKEETRELTMHTYMLPAMSIMFLLFICNIVFEDMLREKESGTLLRIFVSPLSLSEYIWSKILVSALLGMMCTTVLIILGILFFSIQWGNPFLVFFVILSLNILIAGFISLLYSFIRTERQAGALLSTVIIIMSILGGSMMPVEYFPSALGHFSKLTLNYWGIKAFHKVMLVSPMREIFPILIGMFSVGLVFSFTGSYFLNRNLKKGVLK